MQKTLHVASTRLLKKRTNRLENSRNAALTPNNSKNTGPIALEIPTFPSTRGILLKRPKNFLVFSPKSQKDKRVRYQKGQNYPTIPAQRPVQTELKRTALTGTMAPNCGSTKILYTLTNHDVNNDNALLCSYYYDVLR